jgi:alkane 1-monooxygenase
MHQKNKIESQMANILLGMVMYSHSRSEDMLVHHRDIATPRDPITARMGEHFFRYFPRVLSSSFLLALEAEAAILARKDLPATDRGNPFWRYAALQGSFLLLAFILGGWVGVGPFLFQASTPIWQLELVNFINTTA